MKEYIARRISAVHVFDANGNELASDVLDNLGISLIDNLPVEAPTLGPSIAYRTYVVGGSPVTIDLSERFIGAISYGMSPANIPGVTRNGAIVTIDAAEHFLGSTVMDILALAERFLERADIGHMRG